MEQQQQTYQVQLPVFKGPLDLLLHLIEQREQLRAEQARAEQARAERTWGGQPPADRADEPEED